MEPDYCRLSCLANRRVRPLHQPTIRSRVVQYLHFVMFLSSAAQFDFGRFVDPVLLDLCIKVGALAIGLIVIYLLWRVKEEIVTGFTATKENQALEAQLNELRRDAAFMLNDIRDAQTGYTAFMSTIASQREDYDALLAKYVEVQRRISEIEAALESNVKKISIPSLREVHTGDTAPPPRPTAIHKALTKNDSTQTKKVSSTVVKPPIPRTDK